MSAPSTSPGANVIAANLRAMGFGWEDIFAALKRDAMPGVTRDGVRRWFFGVPA